MTKYGPKSIAGEDYKTRMPAYENILSDHDIVAVLSYIKSQWPKKLIRIHNEQINRSQ
jgi:mono/diheme cytochrome c family protein